MTGRDPHGDRQHHQDDDGRRQRQIGMT